MEDRFYVLQREIVNLMIDYDTERAQRRKAPELRILIGLKLTEMKEIYDAVYRTSHEEFISDYATGTFGRSYNFVPDCMDYARDRIRALRNKFMQLPVKAGDDFIRWATIVNDKRR